MIAQRRSLANAWVAFIPLFGPTIVLLWSIDRSGWMCLLAAIPIINIGFTIWLFFSIPAHHGRTSWWGLVMLVPVIGLYFYGFTLPKPASTTLAMG